MLILREDPSPNLMADFITGYGSDTKVSGKWFKHIFPIELAFLRTWKSSSFHIFM